MRLMTAKQSMMFWRAALALALVCGGLAGAASGASKFDELRQAAAVSGATQSEAAILELLKAGLDENKPTQAIAVAQRWLRENVADDPMLLYHAGRAAELSGDWQSAVALYQQYLKRADLKSKQATDAIVANYELLIDYLNNPDSAYAYARTEGHRLVGLPAGRQFDRWFLNEAVRRGDRVSLATRLLALVEAKVSDDLLIAQYERYFDWLLDRIVGARLDEQHFTEDFVQTVRALARGVRFDEEYKLLLDWAVSVKAYNMAKLDGIAAAPPIAQANALLAKYPIHALRVQTDWAGGSRSRNYRGDHRKYWPDDLQAKLAPVTAAVAKLDLADQLRFYNSYSRGYYDGGPNLLTAEAARAFALANPKIVNHKLGPALSFDWNRLSFEQASELAAVLARNPGVEAALVRAVAAAGKEKNLDKAIEALLTDEAWRLGPRELNGAFADQLWHWAGRPGGNTKRDQGIGRSKKLAVEAQADDVKKNDPAAKRSAAFKKLWEDYQSLNPKLPGVRQRLLRVVQLTPEVLADLITDTSVEARRLVHDALESGVSGNGPAWDAYESARKIDTDRYSPCFDELVRRYYGGLSRLRQDQAKYRAHPLGSLFHERLVDQVKNGKIEPRLMFAWLNTQFPEDNAESAALVNRLIRSSAWKSLPHKARSGARRWFNAAAMTPAQASIVESADPATIFKDLRSLREDADIATTAAALGNALQAMRQSPVRVDVQGLSQLGNIRGDVFAAPQVIDRIIQLVADTRSFATDARFGEKLFNYVAAKRDVSQMHRLSAYLWRHTEVHHRTLPGIIDLADAVVDDQPSAAQTLARCGLKTIARYTRGHRYFNDDTDIPRLKRIRGKATIAMGLIDIPVKPNHPAYGIYQSQSQYVIGNEDSARELYLENTDQLLPVYRQLSVSYLLWVLQFNIDQRNEARQEELAKALMSWMRQSSTAFTLEQQVALEIAYGDIAMQRGMLSEAHKIYARIRTTKAYDSVFAKHTATLRQALVERVSGDFEGALKTLDELEAQRIPRLITAAHYARAEVFYATEEYQRSAEEIAKVLDREPDHADATILRGRVQLKLQKLIAATEVELGSVTGQSTLVPGEKLKVTLNDPTLSVSGGGSDIEVVVWATSGDKEHLLLRQFGDEKTKYRGEVMTALGKPTPEDRTLQIVGDDKIYYAYSEEFRAKMVNLKENQGGPITVSSDGLLMASARKLLSENEQRIRDMQTATRLLETKYRNRSQNMDPETLAMVRAEAEAAERNAMLETRVKPGNTIYLRVIDPDRGRTAEVDKLTVSVASSSGDVVGQVTLTETDTHSGQFEGRIQTTKAQALAFGSSSQAGRNPNMVISPKADYPAWRPVPGNNAVHTFTVDLNDNAPISAMRIDASDEGYRLQRFLLQTAMNDQSWTTIASYPDTKMMLPQPWKPSITVANEAGRNEHYGARSVFELRQLQQHMRSGWLANPGQALSKNVAGPSEALPASVLSDVKWLRGGRWPNPAVVVRFGAYFHEPIKVARTFAVDLGKHEIKSKDNNQRNPAEFLIAVDGKIISSRQGKLQGTIKLGPGVHKLEIWATGWIKSVGFGRGVKLRANLDDPEELVECPDSFFDPATFPVGALDHRNAVAQIKSVDDGKRFDVTFAPESRTRLVRLVFVDQQGPVPSLNRLTLTGPKDQPLLPVPEDFAALRKNDQLEIITGDRVTVRYVDDRFVTKGKQNHERFLNVAYTDARIEFADIEPRFSPRRQSNQPYHETMRRFAYDKPLSIVIYDADMDETVEPDEVACNVTNTDGVIRQIIAKETGPSTGTFRGWITPVKQATDDPAQIQTAPGSALAVTYRDMENLRPGVPYDRVASIQHAPPAEPIIEIAHASIKPYVPTRDEQGRLRLYEQALNERIESGYELLTSGRAERYTDRIRAKYQVDEQFMTPADAPEGGLAVVHGRSALIDVIAPHLAPGDAASIQVYVQTDSGRKAMRVDPSRPAPPFDPNAPGTMVFTAGLGKRAGTDVLQRGGYAVFLHEQGNDYERIQTSYTQGRFRLQVPLVAGTLPDFSYVGVDRDDLLDKGLTMAPGLIAKVGERMHVGVAYTDAQGHKQWATASARVVTRPMLDVMQEDFRSLIREAYIGEKFYVRVVDLAQDKTEDRDSVRVYLAAKSGAKYYMILNETDVHSGVFKGVCQLTLAKPGGASAADDESYDVRRQGMPVVYGDTVAARYADAQDRETPIQYVTVAKGADGTIAPFSKKYGDSDTAMRTQFAMAEGYLELARQHRKLMQDEQADREFDRAKQLLAAVVSQFTDPATRSHAEYLLGNLTMEEAQATEDKQLAEDRYHAALARYMTVTGSYPDTPHASKAQFKIATVYERLNEADIAAQEYVKLAYKYPDSEYLATAMVRLGTHFQRKAVELEKQAQAKLAMTDDPDAQFDGEAIKRLAFREYVKSAQIFERLQERFPSHELAGAAGLRAGKIYMRAERYRDAVAALQRVVDNETYDGVALRSEAMYWAGRCYQTLRESLRAYAMFKRITYDFPESDWAAYARAQLSTEAMLRLDQNLEIQRLEAGQ